MDYCGWKGKEFCDVCKRPKLVDFNASGSLWADVIGPYDGGVFCLHCFVDRANYIGRVIRSDEIEIYIYNPVTALSLQSMTFISSEKRVVL